MAEVRIELSEREAQAVARAAAHVDRLAGDIALHARLMQAGLKGRDWEEFRAALAAYAVQVVSAWTMTGRIFVECAKRGWGVARRHDTVSRDDARELAGEVVARALTYFRDSVLGEGAWDPTRGAALRTFFVGACVLHFPAVYRPWTKERWTLRTPPGEVDVDQMQNPYWASPVDRIALREVFAGLPGGRLRNVLTLRAQGFTIQEIAEVEGCTEKAIESLIDRFRARCRRG